MEFSSINGDGGESLDSYYSTIDDSKDQTSPGTNDDYKSQKKSSFDSEYERMMSARGDVNGGQQQQQIDFSR